MGTDRARGLAGVLPWGNGCYAYEVHLVKLESLVLKFQNILLCLCEVNWKADTNQGKETFNRLKVCCSDSHDTQFLR